MKSLLTSMYYFKAIFLRIAYQNILTTSPKSYKQNKQIKIALRNKDNAEDAKAPKKVVYLNLFQKKLL